MDRGIIHLFHRKKVQGVKELDSELIRRKNHQFYGKIDTGNMELNFLTDFYKQFFKKLGFEILFHVNVVRVFYKNNPMTYYFAYNLKRV